MAKNYKYFCAAGLSGLLLALAYPGWSASWRMDFGWLIWIMVVPLLWALTQFISRHDRIQKRIGFLIGFTAGLVYFLIIFRWFWSVHPLDTLGIQSKTLSFAITGLIYFISSVGMAVFWGLFALVYIFLSFAKASAGKQFSVFSSKNDRWLLKNHGIRKLLTIPALFVLFEYVRSWGFGFLWAGSGSLFGPHWTMGNLAYSLANNPLALKLASFVGIYGITFFIVLVNCLIFIILKNKLARTTTRAALVGLIVIAVVFGPKLIKFDGKTEKDTKRVNFAIIQTTQQTKLSPSPQEVLTGFKEQLELLTRVAKEYPESQFIVFPEASDFFKNLSLFLSPMQVENYFAGLFKEPRLIISGGRVLDSTTGNAYSRVFSLDTRGDILGFYDKRLLTPNGEFLSYPVKFLAYMFLKNKFSFFNLTRDLDPGQKEISTVGFRYQFNIAPLVCSELISPNVSKQATQNADVIISMASYGIFHGNRTIADQMLAITRFRAVENRKPVITAANLGRSHVIDRQGNIFLLAPDVNPQILTGTLVLKR